MSILTGCGGRTLLKEQVLDPIKEIHRGIRLKTKSPKIIIPKKKKVEKYRKTFGDYLKELEEDN